MDDSIVRYNAQTRRLSVFLEFLGGTLRVIDSENIDPDVVTAHNLATESVLKAVRQLAVETCIISNSSSQSDSSRDCETSLSQAVPDGPVLVE